MAPVGPVITLIRHAQGWHNYYNDWSILDPTLTDLGERQCLAVQRNFPYHNKITHILASPLKRTIQTAVNCFKPAIDRGIRVQPLPEVIEIGPEECNQGHNPEDIIEWARSTFGGDFLDEHMFSLMPSDWSDNSTGLYEYRMYEYTESKLRLRAEIARQIIRRTAIQAGDRAHIVVVSHSQFLPYLTQEQGPDWGVAEWRTYTIASDNAATMTRIHL
ncbi:hypothetical protein KVR01_012615 [Diaporthe batatas]|uniref:uncharacterized protein n=1 Tax=Diaporthe batatas TaxID=748121 RepID=UPI001D04D15E|nr:uncharacterized protein KVR01_012615 [Diaporthe batatas]KAG8157573.1 hypothetical protein KVR01_012615 [Diaporthe batatas]